MAAVSKSAMPSFPVRDGPGLVAIRQLDNGHLECTKDKTYWCDHISDSVQRDLDVEPFWKQAELIVTTFMEVPIIPTANLWDRVRLDTIGKIQGFSVVQIGAHGEREDFIGFIHPGEGRRILRTMLFDWFAGNVDENIECDSKAHSYAAQMRWEADGKNHIKSLAQRWSAWYTGSCLFCSSGGSNDFSDLVPDAGKTKSPFGGRP